MVMGVSVSVYAHSYRVHSHDGKVDDIRYYRGPGGRLTFQLCMGFMQFLLSHIVRQRHLLFRGSDGEIVVLRVDDGDHLPDGFPTQASAPLLTVPRDCGRRTQYP